MNCIRQVYRLDVRHGKSTPVAIDYCWLNWLSFKRPSIST